ncbi:hypothetical protein D3C71_1821210 [compost metagenome]
MQAGQYLAFGQHSVVVGNVARDFEDGLIFAAIPAHHQGIAGRTTAHALHDGETALQTVTCTGNAGIDGSLRVRRGQLVFDQIKIIQKAMNGVVASQHVWRGSKLDEILLTGAAAVQGV